MKLTWKLTMLLVLGTLAVTAVHAAVRVRREVALFESDIRQDHLLLGRTLAGAVGRIWRQAGEAQAQALVGDANERESHVDIRWVWLDAPAGAAFAPRAAPARLAALARGESVGVRLHPDGAAAATVYTYVPIAIPGGRLAAVELGESLAAERSYVRRTIRNTAVATLLIVAVCGVLAMGLGVAFVGRPVGLLVAQARRVGRGDLSGRLAVAQRDEIGELAGEMNAMCDRLAEAHERVERATAVRIATLEQLRHADRLTTVGQLASGVAHELGTPLNVVAGRAQLVVDDYPAGSPAHDNSVIVVEQAERMAGIIRNLLDFARRRPADRVTQAIGPVVAQTLAMLGPLARKREVALEAPATGRDLRASFDAGQVQQVLMNVVVNAIQSTGAGGTVSLALTRELAAPPASPGDRRTDCVRIDVRDTGSGMSAEVLEHVFEPFYTTKEVGEGTGLGLSVAHGIVTEHGGWITASSEAGRGSRFSVYLPAEEDA